MTSDASVQPNRLIREKSPYLQQHAYNPVDWYPWGPEAFEKARQENKPILVSIGYSTCHWCHVMERESYEDSHVAELMNRYLINIKVDREERPDVDKIYMTAASAMTGSGGWPLNVFLTPDLKPFFGGTYFPPSARWGHPGWADVVRQIGHSWENSTERQKMLNAGEHIVQALQQVTRQSTSPLEGDPTWFEQGFKALKAGYDESRGGFGPAPKFPMPVYHNYLLRYYARTRHQPALGMSLNTLRQMAQGGIYDHLGGGFARYSTDDHWHVPHFEKMLYDNAQLAVNYIEAFQITHELEFKRIARETLDYMRRDLGHPEGGFYSAEDADSLPAADGKEKKEGAFYAWEKAEVIALLGQKNGELFCFRYGIREKGNAAQDPHDEFGNKNILYKAHPIPETAKHFGLSPEETEKILEESKHILFQARQQRPRPHRDDKVLSAWNGLTISAYAKAFQVFGDENDLRVAQKTARFLKAHLLDPETSQLYRRWRDGERKVPGMADDYAFVVQGLIDLYEADFDPLWLDWALQLTDVQNQRFYDVDNGGFFMTAVDQDPHLPLRVKEDSDNVEPSASSVATLNLLRLSQYMDRDDFRKMAERTLQSFGTAMKDSPRSVPQMLVALDYALTEPRQVVIAGKPESEDVRAFFRTLHAQFVPVKTVMLADGGPHQRHWVTKLPFLETIHPLQGKATAYVCIRHVCKQPTTDLQEFQQFLEKLGN